MTATNENKLRRTLRYLAPNAVTGGSIVFAVLALQAALRGEIIWGAWWALYSTLTDKLDGLVARLLNASSPIGVQLDSLADLLNYGMVPATLTYAFFMKHPELGWATGLPNLALRAICSVYVLCAAVRLARFNVSTGNPRFFFGVPSTMSGAAVLAMLITLCKYSDPSFSQVETGGHLLYESFPGLRLLGSLRLDGLLPYYPIALLLFGLTMISRWRVPKIGMTDNRLINIYIVASLLLGYAAGIVHWLPEYIVLGSLQYLLLAAYFHFFASPPERPDPLFPAS